MHFATSELKISWKGLKMPVLESLFYKFVGLFACNFIKKRLQQRCFSVNIGKFFKNAYFEKYMQTTSVNSRTTVFQESLALLILTKCLNIWNLSLGWVGLAAAGSNWKPIILSSIFSRVFQILVWKYLFCVQQEVCSFYFSLFCSQLVA